MQTTHVRAEPNVTPMIDVMLVLLIIFMAVGPLLVNGIVGACYHGGRARCRARECASTGAEMTTR
jgi:hypothetical protein